MNDVRGSAIAADHTVAWFILAALGLNPKANAIPRVDRPYDAVPSGPPARSNQLSVALPAVELTVIRQLVAANGKTLSVYVHERRAGPFSPIDLSYFLRLD